ncbi:hypothetical protein RM543_10435 [Roseicyclus sp. F158]|uniref:Bro-N domain-containing protein n=1 Tax=Tropicimonas omnivorans TaxID=3075590 RepID=A0ABU3DHE3_9RHOB|nr:hypothetical protein [Roseicyclus sp. F158]MDT0683104.1 hypothetical protein [Roseicyclus sp. F158]
MKQHFTGSFIDGDDEGREIEFESHTEFMVALVMLARPEVVNLENQVLFRWLDEEEKPRRHFFDYRVTLRDGRRIALVVKKKPKASDPEFRLWLRGLAHRAVPAFADRLSLITMADLDPIEVHNAELIHAVRQPDPEPDGAVREVVASIVGAARISDIATAAECRGSGFRSVVRMIRSHELELVAHERISPDTLVRRRAS